MAPHRIVGDLYYVGTQDLASFLLTSPDGHILINSGLAESTPLIRASVEKLGFKFNDIKILLTTQAHYDHVAALAEIKKITGARMLATPGDSPLLEDGGKSDHILGPEYNFAPIKVDGKLQDNKPVTLGGKQITPRFMYGHTRGSTGYSLKISEGGKSYDVLIANMATILDGVKLVDNPRYPGLIQDLERTFKAQHQLPCDIFLSSHAGQYNLHAKWSEGKPYSPETFRDPEGYKAAVASYEDRYRKQLATERAGKK